MNSIIIIKLADKFHNMPRLYIQNLSKTEKKKYKIILTGNLVDSTTPQISVPTKNCSPSIAIQTFSHALSILCFRKRITHLPPFELPGSSHIGFIPFLNKCNSRNGFNCEGRIK